MTPEAVITTAGLLGAYVLCGGLFGTCYAAKDVHGWHVCAPISALAYAAQVVLCLAILIFAPLGSGWKLLIAVSTAAYAVIPEFTLRYLRRIHVD